MSKPASAPAAAVNIAWQRPWRYRLIGAACWLGFFVALLLLTQGPTYTAIAADQAELKLSLAHLTQRLEPCEVLSMEEIAQLPPNMRIAERCPRERARALLEVYANDQLLLREQIRPAGLHRGGRSYWYQRWILPAGEYQLRVALRDSPREIGFDQEQTFSTVLAPGTSVLLHIGDGDMSLQTGKGR